MRPPVLDLYVDFPSHPMDAKTAVILLGCVGVFSIAMLLIAIQRWISSN